jgi:hypothetical protein
VLARMHANALVTDWLRHISLPVLTVRWNRYCPQVVPILQPLPNRSGLATN